MSCLEVKSFSHISTQKIDPNFLIGLHSNFTNTNMYAKGQIKPKADWGTVDSPKKRTDEFVCFLP